MRGIDTSHHQGDKGLIDWKKVKAAGYDFAFLKATQGTSFKDGQYLRDRKEARAAGMIVGHYHFAGNGSGIAQDPKAEADFFLSVVGDLLDGEPLVLDWEIERNNAPAWCLAFLARVEEKTSIKPLLYTNEARVVNLDWSVVVGGDFGLWVAKYGINDGKMHAEPKIGKWPFLAIWQYTSSGKVPGIVGNVDLDIAYMSAETLKKYGKQPAGAATQKLKSGLSPEAYHRYGHLDAVSVKVGDHVKRGEKIGTIGTGNGQWSAHLHYDVSAKPITTEYVIGWTINAVKAQYIDPYRYIDKVAKIPAHYHHLGYDYLDKASYSGKPAFHPGVDINGPGAGNADLGLPIVSACEGEVTYCYSGTGKNGGWGKLVVIKESVPELEKTEIVIPVIATAGEPIAETIPVRVEQTSEAEAKTEPTASGEPEKVTLLDIIRKFLSLIFK